MALDLAGIGRDRSNVLDTTTLAQRVRTLCIRPRRRATGALDPVMLFLQHPSVVVTAVA